MKLFSKNSNLYVCDHTQSTNVTTDGQTYYGNTALCVASRGKNRPYRGLC